MDKCIIQGILYTTLTLGGAGSRAELFGHACSPCESVSCGNLTNGMMPYMRIVRLGWVWISVSYIVGLGLETTR